MATITRYSKNDTHIIHNDSKENNYMVDDKGDIFIIDWVWLKKTKNGMKII